MSTGTPLVTVVVVTWEGHHLLGPCLSSLREQTLPHQVVVVDNASTDGTPELLESTYPEAQVIRLARNTGFAGGVAAALPLIDTRFVASLNNDAEAEPGWLEAAVSCLESNPRIGSVSSRMLLVGVPARLNNTGIQLSHDGYGGDRGFRAPDGPPYDEPVEVFGASGGAGVYRTLAVKAVGGVEPRYFMYYEDADLAWRLRLAGWINVFCPTAVVHHRHGASSHLGSATFAFHNERNRLLILLRCAPLWFAIQQTCQFVLTTASLATRRLLGKPLPPAGHFSPRLRLSAFVSAIHLAPRLIGVRWASSRQRRAQVLRDWRATPERPIGANRLVPA